MKNVYFILGIHNHQPVGNFDFVLEEALKKAYRPFLECLARHPEIKISLHYSGILWEWLEDRYPDMIDLCRTMLDRGQIEILSGGFYEPILSIIPDHDKLGQMNKMADFINRKFGVKPQGLWLGERVWEPSLPKFIHNAGLQYVIVDDLHFMAAGLEEKELHGYYLTDDQGKAIKVFPGSKRLRYIIPFQPPEKTIEYLAEIGGRGSGDMATMADDGEKFGIWPGTYKWVYEQGWLERFFNLIEQNRQWLKMCTYSEYIAQRAPLGRIYLPTASYTEMEEWALPFDAQRAFISLKEKLEQDGFELNSHNFIRGGLWRNFLCKYKEGSNIYNRMLDVSEKIEDTGSVIGKGIKDEGGASWLSSARNEIWRGQCNDAYWHGLFGGLYLPHLRAALYSHIIKADNMIENHRHLKDNWIECQLKDMDHDGLDEIIINTEKFCIFIDPDSGGSIYEWDFRPVCFNVINSLIRRPESYHQKILNQAVKGKTNNKGGVKSIHDLEQSKTQGLEKLLVYDRYDRNTLLDHFFDPSVTLDEFSTLRYCEAGEFLNNAYQYKVARDVNKIDIILSRTGSVNMSGLLSISKTLSVCPGSSIIKINYSIKNKGDSPIRTVFGVEFNFNLLAGKSEDRYFQMDGLKPKDPNLASRGETKAIENLCMIDKSLGLEIGIRTIKRAALWRFPIETASNSEGGFEKVYQSSVILFHWPLNLQKEEIQTYDLDCWARQI
ncbi:DUF1926 domain-containing protein [bacterium]|nr:DUF1926 domain-containing protein [bacterium]